MTGSSFLCTKRTCAVRLTFFRARYTHRFVKPISEQLRDAFTSSGLSVQELLDKSGLPIDRSSLSRKLLPIGTKGRLRIKDEEVEALACALGITVFAGVDLADLADDDGVECAS